MYYHLVYETGNKGYLLATLGSSDIASVLWWKIWEMAEFVEQHLEKEYDIPTAIGTPEKVYSISSHKTILVPEHEYIMAISVYKIGENSGSLYILESKSRKFIPEKLKRVCLSEWTEKSEYLNFDIDCCLN